jgi:UDP-glucose 4-epimerase
LRASCSSPRSRRASRALSAYGKSKRHAEKVVQTSTLDWTIVRPPAIYGPRDREMLELFRMARWGLVPMPPAAALRSSMSTTSPGCCWRWCRRGPAVKGRIFEPDDGREHGWTHRELAGGHRRGGGRRADACAAETGSRAPRRGSMAAELAGRGAKLTPDRVGYMCHPDWVSTPEGEGVPGGWRAEIDTATG